MPRYVDGYVLPVPRRNIQAYRRIVRWWIGVCPRANTAFKNCRICLSFTGLITACGLHLFNRGHF
jgi:hypothetical protein